MLCFFRFASSKNNDEFPFFPLLKLVILIAFINRQKSLGFNL